MTDGTAGSDADRDADVGDGSGDDADVGGDGGDEANAGEDDVNADDAEPAVTLDAFLDALETEGRPVATAESVARRVGCSQAAAAEALADLADAGEVGRLDVGSDPVVWYPEESSRLVDRERVVVFPDRREVIVHHPTQFTRARLASFAHLTDTTTDRAYRYEIRREDVWNAPVDDLGDLLARMRAVLPRPYPDLEGWVEEQWTRARLFRLYTHEDGYTVLEADTPELMGNVARQHLDEELHGPISETESWVQEGETAALKRALYEAGYPVSDERDLDRGADLDVDLTTDLRDYQRDWVDRFVERGAGVLVGPPGSGKTVAALGILGAVGGETLVLVPSRELAGQWREELLAHTTLDPDDVGEYHGGSKQRRPVTIATYQTAGMDRHRSLFDGREWGLIVMDEAHHVPAPVFRRAADLQSRHRLGLTATPVREGDDETEVYTLIGPPIGTDWDALFDAGYVAEPEVELRYVPWADEEARNAWANAEGRDRRRAAATNPGKIDETRRLLEAHPDNKALVFVDWLDQGRELAEALDVPFVSGETPHYERERLFAAFRDGRERTLVVSRVGDEGLDLPDAGLAVIASGLGGSRRQGAQRAGRTMRPTGSALVYVLATQGTREEEFARRRTRHLSEKGVRVRERRL
ncbi:MAG: DEAD/DEAH box helicase [Haloferacaceae archaeon]